MPCAGSWARRVCWVCTGKQGIWSRVEPHLMLCCLSIFIAVATSRAFWIHQVCNHSIYTTYFPHTSTLFALPQMTWAPFNGLYFASYDFCKKNLRATGLPDLAVNLVCLVCDALYLHRSNRTLLLNYECHRHPLSRPLRWPPC